MRRIAIDPGDIHVGWATDHTGSIVTGEWKPMECCDELALLFAQDLIDEVVIEEFVLYEWEAANQTWSHLQTPQLIGAIKLICRWFDKPWVEQSATIKKPTRRQLAGRGIKQQKGSIHALDAELHLYYRTLRARSEA
jgi:hypothetical protein